jgi:hypothetical protein
MQAGRVTEIRRANTTIVRPNSGPRTVVAQHPGNQVVVVRGEGQGYVQRPMVVGGHAYVQRTYYVNRVGYVRAYRPLVFRGVSLYFYRPAWYYPLPFYTWAMDPWAVPVVYTWAWYNDPWYMYYGPFFRPYSIYARPSLWLTDYFFSVTLQTAYVTANDSQAQPQAQDPPHEGGQSVTPMSDEVKNMVEAEVRRQLAEAQAEAQSSPKQVSKETLPPSFNDGKTHTFVAPEVLQVTDAEGSNCEIGAGDVVIMDAIPRSGSVAQVRVLASKAAECPVGSRVSIPLSDVAEMDNHMRATLEEGLKALRDGQGKNNLPKLPQQAAVQPVMTPFASAAPDPDAAEVIQLEARQADDIERQVAKDASDALKTQSNRSGRKADSAATLAQEKIDTSPLSNVKVGQSEAEVVAIMGEPQQTSFLGGIRKMLQYPSSNVILTDGTVSSVEPATAASAPKPAPNNAAPPAPAPARPAGAAPRAGIKFGQTEDEVIAILGQPLRVSFLGGVLKQYEYSDQKVIFTDGTVSEIK